MTDGVRDERAQVRRVKVSRREEVSADCGCRVCLQAGLMSRYPTFVLDSHLGIPHLS